MTCRCSNGCLDVLLTVIGLSGSKIAQSDCARNMIIWLLEKDQSMVGLGTVLFDITEMPWKEQCFEGQKLFMLQVLDGYPKCKKHGIYMSIWGCLACNDK